MKANAKAVSDLMVSIAAALNDSLREVQASESDADFRQYRDSVSKIMTIMLLEIMNPLYVEHPDLKPPDLN